MFLNHFIKYILLKKGQAESQFLELEVGSENALSVQIITAFYLAGFETQGEI